MMTRLSDLLSVLENIAPIGHAEPWDNVGLLAGDPAQQVAKVLLTIDYTMEVASEGIDLGCDAVIAYHPPIFKPLKRIAAPGLIYDAVRRGVAIYSPHTALDVAEGGTNDVLADVLGLGERSPLKLSEPKATHCKLVTFVPADHLESLSRAMFEAGAGRIGNYSSCSFRSPGTGTFFGEEGTNPTIGQSGKLEESAEVRIETVVRLADVPAVVRALRAAHPYEEPAFDLNQLAAPPTARGMGRIGTLPTPIERHDLLIRIKAGLGVDRLLVAGPTEGTVTRVAACAGSCGELFEAALKQKAQLYLTGEMRHHDALRAAEAGMTVVCSLHSNSERVTLGRLRERLRTALPGLEFHLSQRDRDPFSMR